MTKHNLKTKHTLKAKHKPQKVASLVTNSPSFLLNHNFYVSLLQRVDTFVNSSNMCHISADVVCIHELQIQIHNF